MTLYAETSAVLRWLFAQEGGETIRAAVRATDRDALINGRWDAIGELLDGMPAMQATAAKLPYFLP